MTKPERTRKRVKRRCKRCWGSGQALWSEDVGFGPCTRCNATGIVYVILPVGQDKPRGEKCLTRCPTPPKVATEPKAWRPDMSDTTNLTPYGTNRADMILYIIRGAPGSGKTTLARALTHPSKTFAADDYMVDAEGNYAFDWNKLPECHKQCQSDVERAMSYMRGPLAVHNTFTQAWEWEPYTKLAEDYGYTVFFIECQNNFGNVHGVSEAKVKSMRARMGRPNV